jgi:hypothetical protein
VSHVPIQRRYALSAEELDRAIVRLLERRLGEQRQRQVQQWFAKSDPELVRERMYALVEAGKVLKIRETSTGGLTIARMP